MSWPTLLVAPILLVTITSWLSWARSMCQNYAAARKIGIPVRVVPFSPFNPFWFLVDRKVASLLRRLPWTTSLGRYGWRGWDLVDRWQSHHEMGDIFVLVTPQYNMVQLNDPEAVVNVFKRSRDFPRPVWVNDVLGVFGPNISCAEGQSWRTQRRVATRCFNEANNEIVWSETLSLSHDMLRYWTSKTSTKSNADDIRTLTLNVLARAGFGKSVKFRGHEEERPEDDEMRSMSYRESLALILENLVLILVLGPNTLKVLARYWLPSKLKRVNEAVVSFQTYMTTMYEEQKRDFAAGEKSSNNTLMALLVRASQEAAEDSDSDSKRLTESEIYGNREPHELDYRSDFPRFKRCLSVLYETLPLYTIVPAIKWTGDQPTTLVVGDKAFHLPPRLSYFPITALCTRIPPNDSTLADEELDMNRRSVFLGWSEGARDCPGKKFSQAEFVALMVGLFREWRVDPVMKDASETMEDARKRVLNLIRDDSGWALLLQMFHPERAPLAWRKAE
ncbi:hypothetical protein PG984_003603 [Apiospora sp. TS-2023a]